MVQCTNIYLNLFNKLCTRSNRLWALSTSVCTRSALHTISLFHQIWIVPQLCECIMHLVYFVSFVNHINHFYCPDRFYCTWWSSTIWNWRQSTWIGHRCCSRQKKLYNYIHPYNIQKKQMTTFQMMPVHWQYRSRLCWKMTGILT